ncbi:MAG TPA: hypothetical protein G4N95_04615 [Anaerolineae bacterium]|nr:hypothetical protein [Anaerolineae bacterium]
MNFDPTIPYGLAIFMGLLAPAMWGSWFITLKYLGDYPLEAFYITLFVTSMFIVWGLGFLLDGSALIGNMRSVFATDPWRLYVTFLCGILYVTGMQLSLRVMQIIGLAVSQPLQASINVIVGTFLSGLIGGMPTGMTVARVSIAIFLLIGAIYLTWIAGRLRNKAQALAKMDIGLSQDPKEISKAIVMLVAASFFVPAYTIALSYGLRSITQPNGMAVMPFMSILCSGAFVGSLLNSGITLTLQRKWGVFLTHGFKTHFLGMISGFAHYGGNIIHTFATRNLSAVVAWPLGITGGLWTQLWGLYYGEFKGSPKIAYVLLFSGLLCYLIGVFVISNII